MKRPFLLIVLLSSIAQAGLAQTICEIQGSGANSPFNGQSVVTEGVVTAIFTGAGSVSGYYIEDPGCDADDATSNGVFVYDPTPGFIATGQRVLVTGQVLEFNGLTEITNATASILGQGSVIPTNISLPLASNIPWERYEGMLLRFPGSLTVTDNQGWVQYGEITLAPERIRTPTDIIDPNDAIASGVTSSGSGNVGAINAEYELQQRSRILLDDGRTSSFPTPLPMTGPDGTLRTGSLVANVVGVLHYQFGEYRLHPVGPVQITHAPRPEPPVRLGDLRAASFNLLNYWTTLGEWGAVNSGELDRQRTKLIAALVAMNADVYALHELENNDEAWPDLLGSLNASGIGAFEGMEANAFGSGGTKSVIFYRISTLVPIGELDALQGFPFQRPHLTQAFELLADGRRFLFSTAHSRSKLCDSATGAEVDQGDGQGCFNNNRRDQANALTDHWAELRTTTGIQAQLIMGDFNAYTEEDPLDILRAAGLVRLQQGPVHSFNFQGSFGSLDHAFGTSSIVGALAQVAYWNINSDEPERLNYTDNNFSRYQPNAFRSSDHDPVIVDIDTQLFTGVAEGTMTSGSARTLLTADALTWTLPTPKAVSINVYDMRGGLVYSMSSSGLVHQMPLGTQAPGLYLWQIVGQDGSIELGRSLLP